MRIDMWMARFLIAVFLLVPGAAHADYIPMPTWDLAPDFAMANLNRELLDRRMEDESRDAANTGPVEPVSSNLARLSYTPSLERRRANLAQFVAMTRAKDPGQADQFQQLFASTDIMAQIAQGLSPYGLSINNLADAYTVYWMNAWQAAYGDLSEDFTREQVQAVRQQAAAAILSTPQFAGITDAQKQEMAEAMLIQAALIASAGEEAQGNPETLARIGAAVKQGAKASGLELDKVVLTPEGFRLR